MGEEGKPYLGVCRVPGEGGRARDYIGEVALTEEEFQRYRAAALPFARLHLRIAWGILERNYNELQSRARFYGGYFGQRRPRGMVQANHAAYTITADVANWLTAFSLYLWHHEKEYSRRSSSGESSELRRFKQACAASFDRSPEYRITYQLRNYVQHSGLPVRQVEITALGDGVTTFDQRIAFLLDRDELLRDGKWKKATADLQAMPPSFDVVPLVEATMLELRTVEREVLRIDLEAVVDAAPALREALAKLGEVVGLPRLLRIKKVGADDLNIGEVPIPTSDDLDRIHEALTKDDPAEFLSPELDGVDGQYTESAEQARRLRVGIELMSVWLEEGGLTERVARTVNELIQREKDAEPVITGAIQVAAFALALASQAVGTSPESFLGSLAAEAADKS
jgi:hypothetical protein